MGKMDNSFKVEINTEEGEKGTTTLRCLKSHKELYYYLFT